MKKMPEKTQKILRVIVLTVVFFVAFSFGFLTIQAAEITSEEVIKMVNASRQAEGLEVLTENNKLSQAAQAKIEDMLKKGYFSHNSPDGKTPWFWIEKSGYDYRYAGENLAMDFKNAKDQHAAWMGSLTHKKNILNKDFQEIGVAVKQGFIEGHQAIVTVQEFGTPMNFIPGSLPQKTPLPQVQALENSAETNLKTLPVIDKSQLNGELLKEKLLVNDWRSIAFLYLNILILLIISIANPLIVAFLIVQFINFKAENEKELILKEQA